MFSRVFCARSETFCEDEFICCEPDAISSFLFLIKRKAIAVAFLIIWLINSLLISLYTKEIKLKRGNKITLKKDKKLFIAYQISLIIGIIVLIPLELKLIVE